MHASTSSVSSPAPHTLDTSPFLTRSIADHILRSRRFLRRPPQPFRGAAAWLLGRSSSRRMTLQEPSVRTRVNAESDWAFSKPIIVLDVLWNLAFVVIAVVLLGLSVKEEPEVPLRLWIIGYGLQCVFHIACVIFQYRRRPSGRSVGFGGNGDSTSVPGSDGGDSVGYGAEQRASDDETSNAKHLESANTIFSFIWWIVGFYWVTAGGQNLPRDSPQLYWLCIFFLAFDVISVFICAAVACLIGFALCCCLPCIVGILCSMTDQEGATTEEIDQLPKYRFRRILDFEKIDGEIQVSSGGTMTECEFDMPTELLLSHEDANCCICLSAYEDGTELRDLPCHHHFHRACIDKWLYINAICPLCKFNILRATNQIGNEEV